MPTRNESKEGNRARWRGRASNPVGDGIRSRAGSTPAAFRQFYSTLSAVLCGSELAREAGVPVDTLSVWPNAFAIRLAPTACILAVVFGYISNPQTNLPAQHIHHVTTIPQQHRRRVRQLLYVGAFG